MNFTAFTFTKPNNWMYCCGYFHSTREGAGICIQSSAGNSEAKKSLERCGWKV